MIKVLNKIPTTFICQSYPGYSVTPSGRVFSHYKRIWYGRGSYTVIDYSFFKELRIQYPRQFKYAKVSISVNGVEKCIGVHRMVLDAIDGPCPNDMICRHLDGNHRNNYISNLKWGTSKENLEDAIKHGVISKGEKHHCCKLKDDDIRYIRNYPKYYGYIIELAKKFKVSKHTIATIVNYNSWRHIN